MRAGQMGRGWDGLPSPQFLTTAREHPGTNSGFRPFFLRATHLASTMALRKTTRHTRRQKEGLSPGKDIRGMFGEILGPAKSNAKIPVDDGRTQFTRPMSLVTRQLNSTQLNSQLQLMPRYRRFFASCQSKTGSSQNQKQHQCLATSPRPYCWQPA